MEEKRRVGEEKNFSTISLVRVIIFLTRYMEVLLMDDLGRLVKQYLRVCQNQRRLDAKTIKAYRIDLEQLASFLSLQAENLTKTKIAAYISDLNQKYKPRTVRRKIASAKALCSYLEYEELISENPFDKLQIKLNAPAILPKTIPFTVVEIGRASCRERV